MERNNELQRIGKPVDADEELGAITYMATRSEKSAGAAVRKHRPATSSGSSVLANMLGASKERYALAVGLDPDLSIAEMIEESRTIMNRKIAPVRIAEIEGAGQRGRADRRRHRSHPIPRAEILARRRRPLHRHRRHHADRSRPTPAASTSAATGRCCTGRAASGSTARPASTAALDRDGVVEAGQALRGGRRLRHRSGAVHAGGAGVRLQGIRVRRGRRHDGPRHRADRRRNRQPADPGPRRTGDRRRAAARATSRRKDRSASSPAITAASVRRSR